MLRLLFALMVAVSFVTPLVAEDVAPAEEGTALNPIKLAATDLAGINSNIGKQAVVEGKVTRTGTTQGGGITFLNFGGRGTFVVVIFKDDYAKFPQGFDGFRGKTIRVSGKLSVYKDSVPEIIVKSPDQIETVETAQ